MAQVVARVVFAQTRQAFPHLALGGDDFQPQAQIAGVAVAQHLRAARIGRQVAADGATALGSQAQRKQQPGPFCCFLHRLQNAARFSGEGEVRTVDGANAVQALQAQHHFTPTAIRHASHHQAGIAALGHDGYTRSGTGPHHGSDLRRRSRTQHRQRMPLLTTPPIALPRHQVSARLAGEYVGGADDGAQLCNQRRWGGCGGGEASGSGGGGNHGGMGHNRLQDTM